MTGALRKTTRATRLPDRLVASPTLNPRASLEEVLEIAASAGFASFEVMTDWAASAFSVHGSVQDYLEVLRRHGLVARSLHLPRIVSGEDTSRSDALAGIEMAAALGAEVVIYKADSAATYAAHAGEILDLAHRHRLKVAITNHKGSAISSLEDYMSVLRAVDDDRLGALLEIGHFAAVGVDWQAAAEALAGRIELVHVKDIRDGEPVTYGTGVIDFAAIFAWLQRHQYTGPVVVEIEKVRDEDVERELATAVSAVVAAGQWP